MEKKLFTFEEVKQKLVNYCVYQDRCHKEVEEKMRDFVLIEEAKEEILLYLLRENYLNEERFTRSFIRGKFYQKSWGKTKLRLELLSRGIPEKLILKSMDEIDESDYENTILRTYEKYYEKQNSKNEFERKAKTIRYLLSRGFEYEEVRRLID